MHRMRYTQSGRQTGMDSGRFRTNNHRIRDYMFEDDYSDKARLDERIQIRQFRFRQSILPYRRLGTRSPIMSSLPSSLRRERSE
jgi:hypothetical protein